MGRKKKGKVYTVPPASPVSTPMAPLHAKPLPYEVWGRELIEPEALTQMEHALRLPIAVGGALMPDAHVGYGLPIGGVLATHDTVIPYAVGVDIGCRMHLSIFADPPSLLDERATAFEQTLIWKTRFGAGGTWKGSERAAHPILDAPAWRDVPLLRDLRATAQEQLGTSGSGNHFVEWGRLVVTAPIPELRLMPGEYLALLSHSGSRGVGFRIAQHYTKIAAQQLPDLPEEVRHLAWLPLGGGAGAEYWRAMELAGEFARANHEVIHQRVSHAAGLEPVGVIQNHHNFAWRERLADGRQAIVHRKGATPAGPGVLGIIPGSMSEPGYIVRGRGSAAGLNSAAHGAGRRMSRRTAHATLTAQDMQRELRHNGITLIGGSLDEAPQAYKSVEAVIAAQADLLEPLARFHPRIVRMAAERGNI